MIRLYPKNYLLAALLVLAYIGLVGCSQLQSSDDVSDRDSRLSPSTTAEITDGTDKPDTGLLPPGQPAIQTKLMLPVVFNQTALNTAGETTVNFNCTDTDPHPIGQSIARTYALSYEQVMTWFCSGYSFENILVALETSEAVDFPAETLLQMLLEKDWEEIWDEIGFVDNR